MKERHYCMHTHLFTSLFLSAAIWKCNPPKWDHPSQGCPWLTFRSKGGRQRENIVPSANKKNRLEFEATTVLIACIHIYLPVCFYLLPSGNVIIQKEAIPVRDVLDSFFVKQKSRAREGEIIVQFANGNSMSNYYFSVCHRA